MDHREQRIGRRKRLRRRRRIMAALLATAIVLLALSVLALRAFGMFRKAPQSGKAGRPAFVSSCERDKKLILDAPFLDQREKYPTGCESCTAVMALQYFDVDITVEEFIDGYLPMGNAPHIGEDGVLEGCDPRKEFPGDPRTEEGWGCYAPVIQTALTSFLKDRPETALAVEAPGQDSLRELCTEYVGKGLPVLVWATIDMAPPEQSTLFLIEGTGEEFQWVYPMHCLLLVGWDSAGYYFNDPSAGAKQFYPKEAAESAYEALGRQALALVPLD